jgi:hypothetical protein
MYYTQPSVTAYTKRAPTQTDKAAAQANRQSGCIWQSQSRSLSMPIPVCCWQSQAIEGKAVQCPPASMRVVKAAKQRGSVKSLEETSGNLSKRERAAD